MRRTRRANDRTRSTFFTGREFSRLSAAVLMLVVLAMLIASASKPSTWVWLTGEPSEKTAVPSERPVAGEVHQPPWQETVVRSDIAPADSEEREAALEEFEAISDKAPLAAEDMPSYWRLLRWARSQSSAELKAHARRDVLYTQLWEKPDKYRGELIRLRLHVVRSLEHEAPSSSAGFSQVCEVWGWTDESQSFPYVAVLVERPPQLKLGAKVEQEGTFVGYFLKTMAYTDALGERRASPLLLGRLQCEERVMTAVSQPSDSIAFWQTIAVGGGVLAVIVATWYWRSRSRRRSPAADPGKNADTDVWLHAVQTREAPLVPSNGNGHLQRSSLSPLFDAPHEHDEGGFE